MIIFFFLIFIACFALAISFFVLAYKRTKNSKKVQINFEKKTQPSRNYNTSNLLSVYQYHDDMPHSVCVQIALFLISVILLVTVFLFFYESIMITFIAIIIFIVIIFVVDIFVKKSSHLDKLEFFLFLENSLTDKYNIQSEYNEKQTATILNDYKNKNIFNFYADVNPAMPTFGNAIIRSYGLNVSNHNYDLNLGLDSLLARWL